MFCVPVIRVVLQEDPLLFRFSQVPSVDWLGEYVAVIGLLHCGIYVPCTVQSLISHLYCSTCHPAALLHILDELSNIGLLRFVAGVHSHWQRNQVSVKQQCLTDDRLSSVFLWWPFLLVLLRHVDLEIVIRAVKIAGSIIPFVQALVLMVEQFYVLFVWLPDKEKSGINLILRHRLIVIEHWKHIAHRLGFGAWLYDSRIDQLREHIIDAELKLPDWSKQINGLFHVQSPHHRSQQEMTDVLFLILSKGSWPHLVVDLRPSFLFPFPNNSLEMVDRIRYLIWLQFLYIPIWFNASRPGLLDLAVPIRLIHLQVYSLFPLILPQKIAHMSPSR